MSNNWTVIHSRAHSGFAQKATGDPEGQDHEADDHRHRTSEMKRKSRRENRRETEEAQQESYKDREKFIAEL